MIAKYDTASHEQQTAEASRDARIEAGYRHGEREIRIEISAAQRRAKELQTRMTTLETCHREAISQAKRWRNTEIDAPGVTVGHDATILAIEAEIQKTLAEQMTTGFEIQKLQGVV